jgi:hypothetical protein
MVSPAVRTPDTAGRQAAGRGRRAAADPARPAPPRRRPVGRRRRGRRSPRLLLVGAALLDVVPHPLLVVTGQDPSPADVTMRSDGGPDRADTGQLVPPVLPTVGKRRSVEPSAARQDPTGARGTR